MSGSQPGKGVSQGALEWVYSGSISNLKATSSKLLSLMRPFCSATSTAFSEAGTASEPTSAVIEVG